MADLLDPELLNVIDALNGQDFEGDIWRVTWAARNPLAGNAGGGRWSPDGRFEALYTSLEVNGALAEVYYHLSLAPVMSSSHMLLNHMKVTLPNVLVLDIAQLVALGIEDPLASRLDYSRSQAIGEAAYMMDYLGMIVPSARWDCNNLVLFVDRIDLNEHVTTLDASDVDWPAWKEQSKRY